MCIRDSYGRFYVDTPKAFLGANSHMTLGFGLSCSDGHHYAVRFDRDQPVLAIKVKAATCSWVETIYSEVDGSVSSRKPAPPEAFKDIEFKGGYSYYLGDFYMTVHTTFKEGKATTEWRLKAMRENYENTMDDMLEAYPKLRALPSENRMMWRKDAPKSIPKPIGVGGSIAWADEADVPGLPGAPSVLAY